MKKLPSKVANNWPQFFFHYCQMVQYQPKSQFLFHKNCSPCDLGIMILVKTVSFSREDFCVQPPCGQLNPMVDEMYGVLEQVFEEYFEIFQFDSFHYGGDEVCFNQNTRRKSFFYLHSEPDSLSFTEKFKNCSITRCKFQISVSRDVFTKFPKSNLLSCSSKDAAGTDVFLNQGKYSGKKWKNRGLRPGSRQQGRRSRL